MSGVTGELTVDLRRLVEMVPARATVLRRGSDGACTILAANARAAQGSGYHEDELVGADISTLQLHTVVESFARQVDQALASHGPVTVELTVELPAGRRDLEVSLSPLPEVGPDVVMAVTTDLTPLREVERALDETSRLAGIGHWAWEIDEDRVIWSDELYRIFGRQPDTFEATFEGYLDALHPDERDWVRGIIEQALAGRSSFSFVHRTTRPDGEERIVHGRGRVLVDDQGEPVRMIGTAQDITERVRAEEAEQRLREAQQRHEQGLELNDNVMQGLATARLAMTLGDQVAAQRAVDQTIDAVRAIITELLQSRIDDRGGLRPGDLVRRHGVALDRGRS